MLSVLAFFFFLIEVHGILRYTEKKGIKPFSPTHSLEFLWFFSHSSNKVLSFPVVILQFGASVGYSYYFCLVFTWTA